MMAGKVAGFGFEIISKLDSYLLMTVKCRKIHLGMKSIFEIRMLKG